MSRSPRRFQFSLRFLLGVMAVFALALACPNILQRHRANQLAAFSGLDFRKLDEERKQEAMGLFKKLVPQSGPEFPYFTFNTWYVWQHHENKDIIVFQARYAITRPGYTYIRLFFMNRYGGHVESLELKIAGRNTRLENAAFVAGQNGKGSLVIKADANNGYYRNHIYEYDNRKVTMVRIEDSSGNILPIDLKYGNSKFVTPERDTLDE